MSPPFPSCFFCSPRREPATQARREYILKANLMHSFLSTAGSKVDVVAKTAQVNGRGCKIGIQVAAIEVGENFRNFEVYLGMI
jgi:type IV secretory pathway protease TraF